MLIRKTCIGVTLAATFVLATSLFAQSQSALERFSFVVADAKDASINRAYGEFKEGSAARVPELLHLAITRYASDAERDKLFSTASADMAKVGDIIREMPSAGYMNWPGGSSYTIRYARRVARPPRDLLVRHDEGRLARGDGSQFAPGAGAARAANDLARCAGERHRRVVCPFRRRRRAESEQEFILRHAVPCAHRVAGEMPDDASSSGPSVPGPPVIAGQDRAVAEGPCRGRTIARRESSPPKAETIPSCEGTHARRQGASQREKTAPRPGQAGLNVLRTRACCESRVIA